MLEYISPSCNQCINSRLFIIYYIIAGYQEMTEGLEGQTRGDFWVCSRLQDVFVCVCLSVCGGLKVGSKVNTERGC